MLLESGVPWIVPYARDSSSTIASFESCQGVGNTDVFTVEVLGLNSEAASIISKYSSTLPKRKGF